mmetsp:Transcript_122366/g.261110  ORF Transcript_122366/g.261110 Transcript_122366/m.261110 type:complete len:368 (+) Transcript_122366:58-1161(+)
MRRGSLDPLRHAAALAFLVLSKSAAVASEAVFEVQQGDYEMKNFTNISMYSFGVDEHWQAASDCSFLKQLHAATRRRRSMAAQTVKLETNVAPQASDRIWTRGVVGVAMSLIAGLSTTIGALIVFLLPGGQVSSTQMTFVLALAGGVMLSATILEFWLPVLSSASNSSVSRVIFSSGLGVLSFLLLSKLVPEPHFALEDLESRPGACKTQAGPMDGRSLRLAHVLMLSLTAHNFPEGFAVSISYLGSDSLGFVVMLAIAMHNIPEGIAIAVPVLAATKSFKRALWMTFLSGMAEPLGAVVALLFVHATGSVTYDAIENLLCAVGGVMCAVALKELLPDAWRYGKPEYFVCGSVTGCLLMLVTIIFGA